MANINEFFTLWLKAKHLPEAGAPATISRVTVEDLHPRPGVVQKSLVIWFEGKTRRLILNQTNANALADMAGEDYTKWPGTPVHLRPGKWGTKDTILVGRPVNGDSSKP